MISILKASSYFGPKVNVLIKSYVLCSFKKFMGPEQYTKRPKGKSQQFGCILFLKIGSSKAVT